MTNGTSPHTNPEISFEAAHSHSSTIIPLQSHQPLEAVAEASLQAFVDLSQTEQTMTRESHSRPHIPSEMQMPDLGILNALMEDQTVSDILINGTQNIFIDRAGRLIDSGIRFESQEAVWQVAESIMRAVNQFWSDDCPMVDTRLADGSRVNLVGPPIALDGVSISIRKFPKSVVTLDTMVETKQISQELAKFLREAVRLRLNIIIAGGTSVGKTTFLNALALEMPFNERAVTIEDSAELRLPQPQVVRLESKPSRIGNKPVQEIDTRALVKNALRMRPDRIVVGESRGAEAFDVLQAMNTGHSGSMTTLHANAPRDAMGRLETMVMLAVPNLNINMVRRQIASAVNLVVQISRNKEGVRHISHIAEVCGMEGDTIVMQDLMVYNEATPKAKAEFRWVGNAPRSILVTEAARNAELMKTLR